MLFYVPFSTGVCAKNDEFVRNGYMDALEFAVLVAICNLNHDECLFKMMNFYI